MLLCGRGERRLFFSMIFSPGFFSMKFTEDHSFTLASLSLIFWFSFFRLLRVVVVMIFGLHTYIINVMDCVRCYGVSVLPAML